MKNARLPPFFFLDSISPCKDLLFPHSHKPYKNTPVFVGTVFYFFSFRRNGKCHWESKIRPAGIFGGPKAARKFGAYDLFFIILFLRLKNSAKKINTSNCVNVQNHTLMALKRSWKTKLTTFVAFFFDILVGCFTRRFVPNTNDSYPSNLDILYLRLYAVTKLFCFKQSMLFMLSTVIVKASTKTRNKETKSLKQNARTNRNA